MCKTHPRNSDGSVDTFHYSVDESVGWSPNQVADVLRQLITGLDLASVEVYKRR